MPFQTLLGRHERDLEFHSPVTGPTIKVAEMIVAGEQSKPPHT